MHIRIAIVVVAFLLIAAPSVRAQPQTIDADVCVYAATPSGVLAAVTVKKAGHSVVVVEPSRWVGGMLGAGLKPMQDCPNYAATGGMTRELLFSLGNDPGATRFKSLAIQSPKAIRDDFRKLLDAHQVPVHFEHRIASVEKKDAAITAATFDLAPFDALGCPPAEPTRKASLVVRAKVFIDASYEGDLMPRAGVKYRTGREPADAFNEPLAGVQPPMELTPIDPYVEPGKPQSGLLPLIQADHKKSPGSGDDYTQAYNYRYYTTNNPEHRLPITPPENYDPKKFELVGRYVEHLVRTIPDTAALRKKLIGIVPGWLNSNAEWNYQRESLVTMAPVGISHFYVDGDHATKAAVWKEHQDYLRGLFHFMRTDPRVPESYRKELAELGLDGRHHPETAGWPHQLYIRVSRRLDAPYVITAHDVYNKAAVQDPIALAQYGIDTYPSRRIVVEQDGKTLVGIEGKMFIGGNKGPTNVPYPVSYRAITPRAEQCTNLLVPVCFSATHLGYASARMEPVFMMTGQSAGSAASLALKLNVPVQQVPYDKLAEQLKADGQLLAWTGPATQAAQTTEPLKPEGIVVDDDAAKLDGAWEKSTRSSPFVGVGYRHAPKQPATPAKATFTAAIPTAGRYEVRLYCVPNTGRATNAAVTVVHAGGESKQKVDQTHAGPAGKPYVSLGTFAFAKDGKVILSNESADGYVIADAVAFVPAP